jgi:hypothetical protein
MSLSLEALWKMSEVELLTTYYDTRRQHIERKFARETQRARLDWLKARVFATSSGGVTERKNAVDASEDLARKGQELRRDDPGSGPAQSGCRRDRDDRQDARRVRTGRRAERRLVRQRN